MTEVAARLSAALVDRYRIEVGADGRPPALGQGGMATVSRMNSLLGKAWLRHARVGDTRMSRSDIVPSRGVQPREETGG